MSITKRVHDTNRCDETTPHAGHRYNRTTGAWDCLGVHASAALTASEANAMLEAAEDYARHLWRIVREAIESDPARYRDCRSFEDLHDVCDANEFLLEVDELLGLDHEVHDPTSWERWHEQHHARHNAACDIVTALLIVCRRTDPDQRLAYSPATGATVLFAELPR